MKLIEFEGEITTVGDGGVVVTRDGDYGHQMTIPSTLDEEQACGRRLYTAVRVTIEALDDELPALPATPPAEPTP